MKMKKCIGLSSMALWIYLEGVEQPIRGWSNADGDISPFESKQSEIYKGAESTNHEKEIDISKINEVKIRYGWSGFSDEKHYGKLEIITKE